jgi:hypothetical protein
MIVALSKVSGSDLLEPVYEFYIFGIRIQSKFEEIKEELNGLSFKVKLRGVFKAKFSRKSLN